MKLIKKLRAWFAAAKPDRQAHVHAESELSGSHEKLLQILQPNMPAFMACRPSLAFEHEGRRCLLVHEVPMLAEWMLDGPIEGLESLRVEYLHVFVVIDPESGVPEDTITLEKGPFGDPFLCRFKGGSHLNLGPGEAWLDVDAFLPKALELTGIPLPEGTCPDARHRETAMRKNGYGRDHA